MTSKTFNKTIEGVEIKVTCNDLAENANGSVLIEAGDTVVFINATMSKNESDKDYFPLSVEYEEKFYAVGKILGGRFIRREGRPSKEAILNARIIDRTIRPLFPKGFYREIQVVSSIISFGTYNPNVLALIGTSIALGISDIPWNGPVSGVSFARTNNNWAPFMPFENVKDSPDHILICGKNDIITMIEMEGNEVQLDDIKNVATNALKVIKEIETFQNEIIKEIGKEKVSYTKTEVPVELKSFAENTIIPSLTKSIFSSESNNESKLWKEEINKHELTKEEVRASKDYFDEIIDNIIHNEAIKNNNRPDGRKIDEIRPLFAQAGGVSNILHGSGIFYRGGTHVFTALTLGSPGDSLLLNTIENPDFEEKFIHHYNFPPFSTGETGRIGFTNRRETGHGALAEKAIRPVLPDSESFPYTIRLVSECFSSNGSTSMASTCASTIALMDGGVPIKSPVAGIAIGLMKEGSDYVLLTDIQGPEDHHGDMDFKITCTKDGLTAIQMDVKIEGITLQILGEALTRGREACTQILKVITAEISSPRSKLAASAPTISTLKIHPDSIGLVIGTGGKTIKALRTDTKVDSIDIEDDGLVTISGIKEYVDNAYDKIHMMTKQIDVGDTFNATIKTITEFGAFAEISPGKDGLIHISEFSPKRVNLVEDVVSEGDIVPVTVKEIRRDGKISLSVKDTAPTFFDDKLGN